MARERPGHRPYSSRDGLEMLVGSAVRQRRHAPGRAASPRQRSAAVTPLDQARPRPPPCTGSSRCSRRTRAPARPAPRRPGTPRGARALALRTALAPRGPAARSRHRERGRRAADACAFPATVEQAEAAAAGFVTYGPDGAADPQPPSPAPSPRLTSEPTAPQPAQPVLPPPGPGPGHKSFHPRRRSVERRLQERTSLRRPRRTPARRRAPLGPASAFFRLPHRLQHPPAAPQPGTRQRHLRLTFSDSRRTFHAAAAGAPLTPPPGLFSSRATGTRDRIRARTEKQSQARRGRESSRSRPSGVPMGRTSSRPPPRKPAAPVQHKVALTAWLAVLVVGSSSSRSSRSISFTSSKLDHQSRRDSTVAVAVAEPPVDAGPVS